MEEKNTKAMDIKTKRQTSGDGSVNFQADTIVIGPNLEEVRSIALDVFRTNFLQFKQIAKETVEERAEELLESFLARMKDENPEGLSRFQDPAFQHTVFTAQKGYALSGDTNLQEMLTNLLVDWTKENPRTTIQVVLTEAIEVAPKLSVEQLAAVAVIFTLRHSRGLKVTNLNKLDEYLEKRLTPFIKLLSKHPTCYLHLVYLGCAVFTSTVMSLGGMFNTYKGLFNKGFSREVSEEFLKEDQKCSSLFVECLHNPDMLQINAMDEKTIEREAKKLLINDEMIHRIKQLFDGSSMGQNDVEKVLISRLPWMEEMLDIWNESFMCMTFLTTVGMAIGHAAMRKVLGDDSPLSNWIV